MCGVDWLDTWRRPWACSCSTSKSSMRSLPLPPKASWGKRSSSRLHRWMSRLRSATESTKASCPTPSKHVVVFFKERFCHCDTWTSSQNTRGGGRRQVRVSGLKGGIDNFRSPNNKKRKGQKRRRCEFHIFVLDACSGLIDDSLVSSRMHRQCEMETAVQRCAYSH